jgi:hypothetical protein
LVGIVSVSQNISTCHVNQNQKTRPKHWTFRSAWPKGIWYRKP